MNFLRLFFVILILASSCAPIPQDHYEHERLSFKISEQFFIRRPKTDKHTNATEIKVVHKDLKLFANITVKWMPGEQDLDKELQKVIDRLKEDYTNPNYEAAFGLKMDGKFASHQTRRFDYFINNDARKGSYQAFHCNGLTVIVGEHYFRESEQSVKECIKVIEDTFTCR